jgi:hypothetical protein
MVDLEQQGGPLGKWGLHFRQCDSHLRSGQSYFTQGKVVNVLDRIDF